MRILIKNGRVLDPASGLDQICDVLTQDSKILKILPDIEEEASDRVIDASGCFVMPGLIDLHVHLRDPGLEYKETIETGALAAAKGGFTTITAMANTNPVIDDASKISYVYEKAARVSPIHILQTGSLTKGMQGEELSPISQMIEAGCPALSEDGKSVMNAALFREALKLAAKYQVPVLDHCEDSSLKGKGVMNDDEISKALGLPGISNAVEDVIIARDILLAEETHARLHICHCSTERSVALLRDAKRNGIAVTAEVCPHHFTLSSDDIVKEDSNYKMAPPLRSRRDMEALRQGLKEGIIDAIATDHAPHSPAEKDKDWLKAAFGIVGLETAVALTITELVEKDILTPLEMAERMSLAPARILGLDKGTLTPGKEADITIIDPSDSYLIDKNTFLSKGRNTPFDKRNVQGRVLYTICTGKVVYEYQKN